MGSRVSVLRSSLLILIFVLLSLPLLNANVFSKRMSQSINHRDYPDGVSYVHYDNFFIYSDTQPALIDTIITVKTSLLNNYESTEVTVCSFIHTYSVVDSIISVNYFEYRNSSPFMYATYQFVFDSNDDMLSMFYHCYDTGEIVLTHYNYRNVHQPDSIYYQTQSYNSHFTLQYDEQDRLISSYWYLEGAIFRRWLLSYNPNPYQYPQPIDFNNYRFYCLTWGGFENSSPIFDKNYAPSLISYQYWSDDAYWYTSPYYGYGVIVYPDEIALLNNEFSPTTGYYAYFYYDFEGKHTHKTVNYNNGQVVNYELFWIVDSDSTVSAEPDTEVQTASMQVYPNPFYTGLNIKLSSKNNDVAIYNTKGQLIRSWKEVKSRELVWDGKDSHKRPVSSGIYLVRAKQGSTISTTKILKY